MAHSSSRRLTALLLPLLAALVLLFSAAGAEAAGKQATASNGPTLYFAIDNTIYSMNTQTGSFRKITKVTQVAYIGDISYYNGYLYFCGNKYVGSDGDNCHICRIKAGGTGFQDLGAGFSPRIYGGKIYYSRGRVTVSYGTPYTDCLGIGRMALNGSSKKALVTFSYKYATARGLEVLGDRIYFIYSGSGGMTLRSCPISGGNTKVISSCGYYHATNGSTYFYQNGSSVYKIGASGKSTYLFKMASSEYRILGLRAGYLYYGLHSYNGPSNFRKRNLSTGSGTKINSMGMTAIHTGTGKFIVVERYDTGGNFIVARMTTAGKSYKKIGTYHRA